MQDYFYTKNFIDMSHFEFVQITSKMYFHTIVFFLYLPLIVGGRGGRRAGSHDRVDDIVSNHQNYVE